MNRRQLLQHAGLSASLFGLPLDVKAATNAPALPDATLLGRDPEKYWTRIRDEQFLLPDWRAFLNNGSLGIAPKPVVNAVMDYLNRAAGLLVTEYPRWGYETLDEYRTEIAAYVGCKKDELALVHNATEAMSTVAAGLELKAGDEVVLTDQEHPSGRSGWLARQARHGISVRVVNIPLPPKSSAQLADIMISAIGPRTKVISFSGITSPTGLIMPAKEICEAARAKGVLSVIDGAHMHGQIPVKISDLGCDFFAGSPHKWMFAPAGCGLLYIREENLERLWPSIVTGDWDNKEMKAARFMRMGTNNRAIFEGMMAGLRFAKQIGPERIYARIHQLGRMTFDKARALPFIEMVTPDDDRMFGGLVTIKFKKDASKLWEQCRKQRIWVNEGERIRLSAHIHTRPSDLDLFFNLAQKTLG